MRSLSAFYFVIPWHPTTRANGASDCFGPSQRTDGENGNDVNLIPGLFTLCTYPESCVLDIGQRPP